VFGIFQVLHQSGYFFLQFLDASVELIYCSLSS
jgi:hypothetical protein